MADQINWEDVARDVNNGSIKLDQILPKLAPEEFQAYGEAQKSIAQKAMTNNPNKAGDAMVGMGQFQVNPEDMVAGGVVAKGLGSLIPKGALKYAPAVGRNIQGAARGTLLFEGGRGVLKSLGAPDWLSNIGGLLTSHGLGGGPKTGIAEELVGSKAARGVGNAIEPMSEVEYLSRTGHPRGEFGFKAPQPPSTPFNPERGFGTNPNPSTNTPPSLNLGRPGSPFEISPNPAPSKPLNLGRPSQPPKNQSFSKTGPEADRVGTPPPKQSSQVGSRPAPLAGEEKGMEELDRFQKAIHGDEPPTRGNGAFEKSEKDIGEFMDRATPKGQKAATEKFNKNFHNQLTSSLKKPKKGKK